MGRLYHAKGVERLVRNSLWKNRSPDRFYDAVEWLYDWRPAHCLDDAELRLQIQTPKPERRQRVDSDAR